MKKFLILLVLATSAHAEDESLYSSSTLDPYCSMAKSAIATGVYTRSEIMETLRAYDRDVRVLMGTFSNPKLADRHLKASVHLQTRVLRTQISNENLLLEWTLSDVLSSLKDLENSVEQKPIARPSALAILNKYSRGLNSIQECIR